MTATTASQQVISLPAGGGALHGLGESFTADLFTGTGNLTVPLALPPGRNGFQPELALTYSTGAGNGPFGLGWDLPIPRITRKTSRGVPGYDDRDRFVLSGGDDLVPVEITPSATRYRPRTEGLFARIVHRHHAGDDFWQVRSTDGRVRTFGTPAAAGDDPAVVARPEDPSAVLSWHLTRTEDPHGNAIGYTYRRDRVPAGRRGFDQIYLRSIGYVDVPNAEADDRFLVTVRLVYDDDLEPGAQRPDPFSDHRAGFEVRTRWRCRRLEVRTHASAADSPDGTLTRSYDLVYLDQRVAAGGLPSDRVPPNNVSLLSQVVVTGHDDTLPVGPERAQSMPPLELDYTGFRPDVRRFLPVRGPLPASSLAHPDLDLVDLSGNGLPDVLEMNGAVRYWTNQGDGTFARPRAMATAPAGLRLADPGVQLLDADGDGRVDLMVHRDGLAGFFPLTFDGEWDARSLRRYDSGPTFRLTDPQVALVDIDGDGVTDAVRSGTRFECFIQDPDSGWDRVRAVPRRHLDDFPDVDFADPRVRWADMTGDGLQDVLLLHDGSVDYWPSQGRGDFAPRVRMAAGPRLPHGYDPRRVLVGDVDGDGCADIVYVDAGRVLVWINQSGNGWSPPLEVPGTPFAVAGGTAELVDLLGTGTRGVLWSADSPDAGRDHAYFLDLTGGTKPYLLDRLDNHIGATTRVSYEPSTRSWLLDAGSPATRWQASLPFPVQVVARVETTDQVSGGRLTARYRYHHGHWDGVERDFVGFGMVEQLDTDDRPAEDAGASPTLTRTWFHLGAIGPAETGWREADYTDEHWPRDPPMLSRPDELVAFLSDTRIPGRVRRDGLRALRGTVVRTELYGLDGTARAGRPYTVTETAYGLAEVEAPGPGARDWNRVFCPQLRGERSTRWERGDDPATRLVFYDDHDDYGHPRRQLEVACPRGWTDPSQRARDYLATCTEVTFAARDDEALHVDEVATTTSWQVTLTEPATIGMLRAAVADGTAQRRLTGLTAHFYDGEPFTGLPIGELGGRGALARTETLVLDARVLADAYGEALPPYLAADGVPRWTGEYPEEFRANLPVSAAADPTRPGLTLTPVGFGVVGPEPDSALRPGYYVATERYRYDFHDSDPGTRRGLVTVSRDPLGHDTRTTYDRFGVLPVEVTDPAGLVTTAVPDYRVLQPASVTGPNGDTQAVRRTPLGLISQTALIDPGGAGDTEAAPSTRFVYDLVGWVGEHGETPQPISVRTVRRVHHVGEPTADDGATVESVQYSDGFGRLVQTRTRADDVEFAGPVPGQDVGLPVSLDHPVTDAVGRRQGADEPPRVLVSGWQRYDGKGRVIERYEPQLATGWAFAAPGEAGPGHAVTLAYDPRGELVRTEAPDGSQQRLVHGIPEDLSDPERFVPTPWETYSYDANDLAPLSRDPAADAGVSQPLTDRAPADHHFTPTSTVADPLGREVETREHVVAGPGGEHVTRADYDVRGNLVSLTDATGRVVFRHAYDLADGPLRVRSIDTGDRSVVRDAAGNEIERRDAKGALELRGYDALDRPVRLWARDGLDQPVTVRERIVYGDDPDVGLSREQAAARNLLGRPARHYDEAGLLTVDAYDFKGNATHRARRILADTVLLAAASTPSAVDWRPPAGVSVQQHEASLLDTTRYETTQQYDALDRLTMLGYPLDGDGRRRSLRLRYDRAGALQGADLEGQVVIERIAYDAKGRRTLVALGNGVLTRHAYDPRSFLLRRSRSERFVRPDPEEPVYRGTGPVLEDVALEHDLAGHLTVMQHRGPGSGIPGGPLGPDALDRVFRHDPLYRLVSATGRECDLPVAALRWDSGRRCADPTRTRPYRERYQYDAVGNLTRLTHRAGGGATSVRFTAAPGANRLAEVTAGRTVSRYRYDPGGNLLAENTARHLAWDHADRMTAFRVQPEGAEASVRARYCYDSGGQRVVKLVRKAGVHELTVYVDGIFEHHRIVQGGATRAQDTLHVRAGQTRVATLRVGPALPGDGAPALQYHLADHLGSSSAVLGPAGEIVTREEYTPYGETSFGGSSAKRYRFTGQERDRESGLSYHGARYYAPWLARWVSGDPAGTADGVSAYAYARGDPIRYADPQGTESEDTLASLHEQYLALPAPQAYRFAMTMGRFLGYSGVEVATGREIHMFDRAAMHLQRVAEHYGKDVRQLPDDLVYRIDDDRPPHDTFFLRSAELEPESFKLFGKEYAGLEKINQIMGRSTHPVTRAWLQERRRANPVVAPLYETSPGVVVPVTSETVWGVRVHRGDAKVFQHLTGALAYGLGGLFGLDYEQRMSVARMGQAAGAATGAVMVGRSGAVNLNDQLGPVGPRKPVPLPEPQQFPVPPKALGKFTVRPGAPAGTRARQRGKRAEQMLRQQPANRPRR